jgi:hypothetical protein
MRADRVVAALLAALAVGLVSLLVFGPVEGAEATEDPPTTEAARAATVSTTTVPATTASSTTAPEPQENAETEQEPTSTEAEAPSFLPGDGTFSAPVTMSLDYESEIDWKSHELERPVAKLRVETRATALRGAAGDVHGIECGVGRRVLYTFLIDPWTGEYMVQKTDPVGLTTIDLERGGTAALHTPPRPNVLSLTCDARAKSISLTLHANGKPVTALTRGTGGRIDRIRLTAWSPEGGQKVVFDGVVVETGRS